MNLWELSNIEARRRVEAVPEWALGCFRRRSITFFDGASDTTTEVIWLQTRGLTADFRLPPARPRLSKREDLATRDDGALGSLLSVEAGVSRTKWDGTLMSWHDWVGFQTQVKWPEPGALRRVGNCLIEFAPSGAYVEDWRLEAPGDGPLVGLELIEEREARDGAVRHRGGALLICGQHAAFVRGRPSADVVPSPVGRTREKPTLSALEAWFACEASYAMLDASAGTFTIVASTSPWREGEALLAVDGFQYDESHEQVIQRTVEDGSPIERLFTVDTLEATFLPTIATEVTADGRSWRDEESGSLLRYAAPPAWR